MASTVYDTMPNRSPSLPIEVCERIIDFLRQDSMSLHSCLLTCRAWVPRAHYLLYTSIRLSTPTGLSLFLRSLHSNPGNVQFVHCLSLDGGLHHSGPATQDASDTDDLMVTAVVRLPRILTSLREIGIIGLPANMHTTFPKLLSQFQAITQLSLESTTLTSFNEFKRHILAFPNLKRLCLFNTTWAVRRQPTPSPVHHLSYRTRSRPALEHVKIYYDNVSGGVLAMEDVFSWLLTTATTSTLAELSVGPLNVKAELIPAFNKLLSNCRNSLHTLEIYWKYSYRDQLSINAIDLRNNLTLRDLRIYDIDMTNSASLLRVAPPSLRVLSVRVLCDFGVGGYIGDSDPAWKRVTSALISGHLHNVEIIRIGLVDRDSGVVIFGHGLRAALKLSELDPRVVLTDYSEDDLQPSRPNTHDWWKVTLDQLLLKLGSDNVALATVHGRRNGVWTFIYTVLGKEYGRGTGQTLDEAREKAAYQTYCTWLKELCILSKDEFRQKYKDIFI